MKDNPKFPNLGNLMDCYFNQDYDLYGDTDADILESFKTEAAWRVQDTIAEIEIFLNSPICGLVERYREETGRGNMMIGKTDAEARDWLRAARDVLLKSTN